MPPNQTGLRRLYTNSSGLVLGASLSALGGFGFDGDIDFGALLELHVLPAIVHQPIGNSDFLVQVIGALNRNLSLLGLSTVRWG